MKNSDSLTYPDALARGGGQITKTGFGASYAKWREA